MRVVQKLKEQVVIKPPKITKATPCALEIAGMFNCWRASGVDATKCAEFANRLTQCMAAQGRSRPQKQNADDINYWLKTSWKRKVL
jgi:hypothetical protein